MALTNDEVVNLQIDAKLVEVCSGIGELIQMGGPMIEFAEQMGRQVSTIMNLQYVIENREVPEEVMQAVTRVNMTALFSLGRPIIARD
jgi:urease gamma subunit